LKYSPWSETRKVKIFRLWEAIAQECLRNGGDHTYFSNLKEIARFVLEHPSSRTMLDYFEDMEDSRWITREGNIVRLLKIPESLEEQFRKLKEEKTDKT